MPKPYHPNRLYTNNIFYKQLKLENCEINENVIFPVGEYQFIRDKHSENCNKEIPQSLFLKKKK